MYRVYTIVELAAMKEQNFQIIDHMYVLHYSYFLQLYYHTVKLLSLMLTSDYIRVVR